MCHFSDFFVNIKRGRSLLLLCSLATYTINHACGEKDISLLLQSLVLVS